MSFVNSNTTWSVKQVVSMYDKGKIDLHHPIQRGDVWENWRRELLVDSLLIEFPIPTIYAKRGVNEKGQQVYIIMEGVQRIRTFEKLLHDKLPVTISDTAIPYIESEIGEEMDYYEIKNKKFSELPLSLQEHLKTTMISFKYFENLTPAEEVILFNRLNMGKPLSSKSKFIAAIKDLDGIFEIGTHSLFEEMLTPRALDSKNQIMIVAKVWCMLYMNLEDVSFELKHMSTLFAEKVINNDERAVLDSVFSLIQATHKVLMDSKEKATAKKLYTETHMVSLTPMFKEAVDRGIADENMANWLMEFFSVKNVEYEEATSGSSKNAKIVTRNRILHESFDSFFGDWTPKKAITVGINENGDDKSDERFIFE